MVFSSHLDGKMERELDYLRKAESALEEDKRKDGDYLVTVSNFAWIHYHSLNLDVEKYLMKRKDDEKLKFKIAYTIPIDSYDRKHAGEKLKQIAEKRLNTQNKVKGEFPIWAFVSAEDKQEPEAEIYLKRAQQHSDTDVL
ncbi:hypothetical protein E1301_Tti006043 [Triplophysa tibetana]|uniref:Uncharacterized protein n=1 Tax=Triplophysa tibetana TaxID=1572043 RepID=A0A5A9PXS1_9TELE|nr:hypothetical protein E1301_Tti006043 [Triplophysa tibetana]